MNVGIHANKCDSSTTSLASALHPVLKELSRRLQGDYGGTMEHLWIDLELVEVHARPDGKPLHPFRFQKRVSGRGHFGLPAGPDSLNVGHLSVRPDFSLLKILAPEYAIPYVLTLIYRSTAVLGSARRRVGDFDSTAFRASFLSACNDLGWQCEA